MSDNDNSNTLKIYIKLVLYHFNSWFKYEKKIKYNKSSSNKKNLKKIIAPAQNVYKKNITTDNTTSNTTTTPHHTTPHHTTQHHTIPHNTERVRDRMNFSFNIHPATSVYFKATVSSGRGRDGEKVKRERHWCYERPQHARRKTSSLAEYQARECMQSDSLYTLMLDRTSSFFSIYLQQRKSNHENFYLLSVLCKCLEGGRRNRERREWIAVFLLANTFFFLSLSLSLLRW